MLRELVSVRAIRRAERRVDRKHEEVSSERLAPPREPAPPGVSDREGAGGGGGPPATPDDEPLSVRNAWVEVPIYRDRVLLRVGKTYRRFGLYNEILDAVPTFIGIEPPELFDKDHLIVTRTTNVMLHGTLNLGDTLDGLKQLGTFFVGRLSGAKGVLAKSALSNLTIVANANELQIRTSVAQAEVGPLLGN